MPFERFMKKPVVVEAIEFTEDTRGEIVKRFDNVYHTQVNENGEVHPLPYLLIETLEGRMRANPGDWIIVGVQGEVYPCKPDIFEQTYEKYIK